MRIIMGKLKVFLFIVCMFFSACTPKPTAQTYIDQGNDLLDSSNYEEAIIAFTSAIEIDENNGEAFRGRAFSYRKSEKYDLAMADYERAIQLDPENIELYNDRITISFEIGDFLTVVESVQKKRDKFGENQLTKEESVILNNKDLMNTLLPKMGSDDDADIISIIKTNDYYDLVNVVAKHKPLLYENNNYLIGVYGISLYIGEGKNRVRHGFGKWYSSFNPNANVYSIAKGTWVEDFPNGEFEVYLNDYGELSFTRQGLIKDGLWEGYVKYAKVSNPEKIWVERYTNGIRQITGEQTISIDGKQKYAYAYLESDPSTIGYEESGGAKDRTFGLVGYAETVD